MVIADISDELAAIKAALGSRPGPTLTGAQLLALIRTTVPELDVRAKVGILKGPGALTEFVRRYLSDVVERVGHLGGDPLYQIKGRKISSESVSEAFQLWRTFVSPNSSQHLVMSEEKRLLIVRDTPALEGAGEMEVAKASPDEHDKIRADFEASLPKDQVLALREHVAPDADFDDWMPALREHFPDAVRKWGHYRRRRLADLFSARIRQLPIEESLQRDALEQIKISEAASYGPSKNEKSAPRKPSPRSNSRPGVATDSDATARRLAHAAIDHLSYDELRALRIPLGVMLDVIRAEA